MVAVAVQALDRLGRERRRGGGTGGRVGHGSMAGVFEREEECCEEAARGGGRESAQAESKPSTQQRRGTVRRRYGESERAKGARAESSWESREEGGGSGAPLSAGLQIGSDSYSRIAASL